MGINSETFVTQESRQTLRHVLKLHPRLIRSYSIGLQDLSILVLYYFWPDIYMYLNVLNNVIPQSFCRQ